MKELNAMKLQVQMLEDGRDVLNRDHKQAKRDLVESKELIELSQKDISELKRLLKDAEMEKEVAWTSCNELRELVKATEGSHFI